MKKILIILLALICLAIIGWLAAYKVKAPAIEADISQRVDEALASNNLSWAKASVDGRDVTITGSAQSEQLRQHAMRTANVYGVNSLQDDMLLQDSSIATNNQSLPTVDEVQVTKPTKNTAPAYPYTMDIERDESGQYTFTGIVPDSTYKEEIDDHLRKVGANPADAIWNVKVSSALPPEIWDQHAEDSISALQLLKHGSASFVDGKAVIQGVAVSQDASDQAEAFAQLLAADYTTDVKFSIVETPVTVAQSAPLVGSAKYAALSCQTEFNSLLKQEKIQFETGSIALQASSLKLLEKVAAVSGRCPDQMININGYTDSSGSAEKNKALSKQRAEAVMKHLVTLGLNPARLKAQGFGEAKPVATNKTENGRAKNRRIELIVKGSK